MKEVLRKMFVLFCILFTVLTLIHYFRGEALTDEVVKGFVLISVYSSVMTFLLRDNEAFSKRRVLIQQVLFVVAVMAAIIVITYYSGWQLSWGVMAINLVIVMALFTVIKYGVFRQDKKSVELLNEALKKRKQEQKQPENATW